MGTAGRSIFKRSKKSLSSSEILIPASIYTVLSWAFFYFSFYAIFLAIGTHINIFYLFVVVTLAKAIGDLTFVPGAIGVTESTLLGLFVLFSVSPVAAAAVIIIQRGLFYFYFLILGYLAFSYMGFKSNKSLKKMWGILAAILLVDSKAKNKQLFDSMLDYF